LCLQLLFDPFPVNNHYDQSLARNLPSMCRCTLRLGPQHHLPSRCSSSHRCRVHPRCLCHRAHHVGVWKSNTCICSTAYWQGNVTTWMIMTTVPAHSTSDLALHKTFITASFGEITRHMERNTAYKSKTTTALCATVTKKANGLRDDCRSREYSNFDIEES
jgi:hypothetical protein